MTYTKFNNYVIDHVMPNVSPNAWKVLCFILRRTNGWHKGKDEISLNQIREGTGIGGWSTISRAIRELEHEQYISVIRSDDKITSNTYSLSPKLELGTPEIGVGTPEMGVGGTPKIVPGVLPKQDTQKKALKKEEKDPTGAAKKRDPPTPAFQIFTGITGYYKINKYWRTKMAKIVGEERPDLELWAKVIKGWTGKGWFDGNVKGMLEFYERDEIPGKEKKNERNHKQDANDKSRKGVLAS